MSRTNSNLAISLASLLLSGNLAGFHQLSLEADSDVIGRAMDLYHIFFRLR